MNMIYATVPIRKQKKTFLDIFLTEQFRARNRQFLFIWAQFIQPKNQIKTYSTDYKWEF